MTMHEFLRKYGTKTVPLLLKTAAEHTTNAEVCNELIAIANDLQEALDSYAEEEG